MIRNICSALFWVLTTNAYLDGNFKASRRWYRMFKKFRKVRPYHEAFDATLMIQERRYEESRKTFSSILDRIKHLNVVPDDNVTYVKSYCEYYHFLSNMDGEAANEALIRAKACRPVNFLTRALPLP